MVGGGLYDQIHLNTPIISAPAAVSPIYQINRYEKPARVIAKTEEETVKKYLDKRKKQKQQTDSWV